MWLSPCFWGGRTRREWAARGGSGSGRARPGTAAGGRHRPPLRCGAPAGGSPGRAPPQGPLGEGRWGAACHPPPLPRSWLPLICPSSPVPGTPRSCRAQPGTSAALCHSAPVSNSQVNEWFGTAAAPGGCCSARIHCCQSHKGGFTPLPAEFRAWGAKESARAAWGEKGKCGKRIPFLCSRGA